MYLLDTNIILEILLKRENYIAARNIFAANSSNDLFITDFSLHSIGVFLFQRNRHDVYDRFVKDIVIDAGISIIGLDSGDVLDLSRISRGFNLDFDDAYQYAVAQKFGLQIVSFDSDFDRTEKGRKRPES